MKSATLLKDPPSEKRIFSSSVKVKSRPLSQYLITIYLTCFTGLVLILLNPQRLSLFD